MNFKFEQRNGLTFYCYATRDNIQFEFNTDSSELSVAFDRTWSVIRELQTVFNLNELTIESFGIRHQIKLEQYVKDYVLTLDGRTYSLEPQVVEQIRYLINNIERVK